MIHSDLSSCAVSNLCDQVVAQSSPKKKNSKVRFYDLCRLKRAIRHTLSITGVLVLCS